MDKKMKSMLIDLLHEMEISVEDKNIHYYPAEDVDSAPVQGFAYVHSTDGVDVFCFNGVWLWLDPTRSDI